MWVAILFMKNLIEMLQIKCNIFLSLKCTQFQVVSGMNSNVYKYFYWLVHNKHTSQ